MKKSLPIILIGGAIAFFLFKDKLGFGKGEGDETTPDEKTPDASVDEKTDAVIDSQTTGGVAQAIQQAKEIAQVVKDAKIFIKTPQGEENIVLRSGKKKRAEKRKKKQTKKTLTTDCSKIRNKTKREKCQKKAGVLLAKTTMNIFSPIPVS